MTTRRQSVVIVGGGYAGVKLARELDEFVRVTLIDPKEAFFHRIASLRASVDGAWTRSAFVPYDNLLDDGTILLDKVVGIEAAEKHVVLASGRTVAYDVLVIATGADYQEPARFTGRRIDDAAAAFEAHQRRVAKARSVLIVGGGPSGVELAAELRRVNRSAAVTLAHSGAHLLPRSFSARPGRRARSWLEEHGVRVELDSFVSAGAKGLQDQKGRRFDPEVVFWTTGNTPNTLWLRLAGHGSWLDGAGQVKVAEDLRVVGQADVFAVGDVNDVPEPKVTMSAMAQGSAAARNILAHLRREAGPDGRLRPYAASPVRAFSVPFGPEAGVTVFPLFGRDAALVGNRPTAAFKSRSLMVPYVRKLLRQPVA